MTPPTTNPRLPAAARPDRIEALLRKGRRREAIDACVGQAVALANAQRGAEAEACCRRALALDAGNVPALAILAALLADSGRVAEGEALYRRVLARDPANAMTHANFAILLATTRRPAEAEPFSRRAVALAPRVAVYLSNLGKLLKELGQETEAEQHLRQAIALEPGLAVAHCNLGVLLADQRRDDEAQTHLQRAIALGNGDPRASLNLGYLRLAQGRFDEGWALHEARLHPAVRRETRVTPPQVAFPMWRGEPLAGKAVLIWPEQGFGDQLQFSRHATQLKALGAARVTLVCRRPLQALLESVPGVDRVIGADVIDLAFHVDPAQLGAHDCWVMLMSLPGRVGVNSSTLQQVPVPYLRAAPERAQAWAQRLARDSAEGTAAGGARPLRVGLVWRGNAEHPNDAERSLPALTTLAPLWSVPGVRFFSLQTGNEGGAPATPPRAQLGVASDAAPSVPADASPVPPLPPLPASLPSPTLAALGAELHDFADTAGALAALDLLICVDTSIAHLAGALGRPCWVLLPQHRTDWRWGRERDDSAWYPQGMRLFRQATRGDWAPVVERVRAALDLLAQAPR